VVFSGEVSSQFGDRDLHLPSAACILQPQQAGNPSKPSPMVIG